MFTWITPMTRRKVCKYRREKGQRRLILIWEQVKGKPETSKIVNYRIESFRRYGLK